MAIYYSSLGLAILFAVAGQIALKVAADNSASVVAQVLNPLTLIGLATYLFGALFYIFALRKIPVSIALPSVAASYALIAVIAHIMWNEPLGWPQVAGILLISGGVLMLNQH
jgi:small multidrug resistance pump